MLTRLLRISGALWSSASWSQPYPAKPVKFVVPFAAGSATDIAARMIAEELRAAMGQSFVVENKPGGSGQIAAATVAKSPADGHTLRFYTNSTHSANPSLVQTLRCGPIKEFTPVARI